MKDVTDSAVQWRCIPKLFGHSCFPGGTRMQQLLNMSELHLDGRKDSIEHIELPAFKKQECDTKQQ